MRWYAQTHFSSTSPVTSATLVDKARALTVRCREAVRMACAGGATLTPFNLWGFDAHRKVGRLTKFRVGLTLGQPIWLKALVSQNGRRCLPSQMMCANPTLPNLMRNHISARCASRRLALLLARRPAQSTHVPRGITRWYLVAREYAQLGQGKSCFLTHLSGGYRFLRRRQPAWRIKPKRCTSQRI